VLSPEKSSFPMRLLIAHRDRKSAWSRFLAGRAAVAVAAAVPAVRAGSGLTAQPRRALTSPDRPPLAFDARYAVVSALLPQPLYEPEVFFLLQDLAPLIEIFLDIGRQSRPAQPLPLRVGAFPRPDPCFEPEPQNRRNAVRHRPQLGTRRGSRFHRFRPVDTRRGRPVSNRRAPPTTPAWCGWRTAAPIFISWRFAATLKTAGRHRRSGLDAMKSDIEGHELHAIEGGIETIRRARPFIVFETIHGRPGYRRDRGGLEGTDYIIFFLEFADPSPARGFPELPTGPNRDSGLTPFTSSPGRRGGGRSTCSPARPIGSRRWNRAADSRTRLMRPRYLVEVLATGD